MRRRLAVLALSLGIASAAHAQTYTLATSWPFTDAAYIASDGSDVLTVNWAGTRVTKYDATGTLLAAWDTNRPDGTYAGARGLGADAAGFVYVMTSTLETRGLVQKFGSDGVLVDAWEPDFPYNLGFAVDAAGNTYGGEDANYVTDLLGLGPDGTRYIRIRPCCYAPIDAIGPGAIMTPGGTRCGGPANVSTLCFGVGDVAATATRLFAVGDWCDEAGVCTHNIHVYGPGPVLLTIIPAYGPLALDATGAVYLLAANGVIEKWVASDPTATATSSWGELKARWR